MIAIAAISLLHTTLMAQTKSSPVGITVSDITPHTASIAFDKADADYGFYAMVDLPGSVAEMVRNYANMGIEKTEQEVFEMFISNYPEAFLYLNDTTLHISGLDAGAEIAVYTLAIDHAGELTGTFGKTLFQTTFATGGTGLAEIELTISDITSYGCHVATAMNDQTAYFYFTSAKSADLASHNLTDAESILAYLIAHNWETWSSDLIGSYGTPDSPLAANTEYQIWLFPYNQNRELGTPTHQTFTTLPAVSIPAASPSEVLSVEYYDLLGRRIEKPQKGIYLERTVTTQGIATRKIFQQ